MKLYLFTTDSAYGQHVRIVAANSLEEAKEISNTEKLGWTDEPTELLLPKTPSILFDGGGDL